MGMLVNFMLIICAVVALSAGVSYYGREKYNPLLGRSMLSLAVFAFCWCGGYSFMGFSEVEILAYIGRTVGLIGIFGFLMTECVLAIYVSGVFTKTRKMVIAFLVLFALIDLLLFAQPETVIFTKINGRTCYYACESIGRSFHGIYIILMFLFMFTLGVRWLLKCKLKRDKMFMIYLMTANVFIILSALPDTILPALGIPSFPSSCVGGFLAYITIWMFATRYNAFSVSIKNLSSYIYNYVSSSIIFFNDEHRLLLANDFARHFLNVKVGETPRLSDLFEISDKDSEALFKRLDSEEESVDCRLITSEKQIVCSLKFNVVKDRFGAPYCYVCFVYDLTEEEEMIKEVNQMKEDIEKKLYEKTKQVEHLTLQSITTIANTVDAKDTYTKGHSVRVAEYSACIAKKLGWSQKEIQNLRYMALLHDIGKVGIPESILNKPGKLSEKEFEIIKSHPTIGGDILKDITVVKNLDAGARYHHERYDGKGYPNGVKDEEIPFAARIICIADAYDAMNSERPYRPKLSPDTIREELINGKGTQFDPQLIDTFIELLDNKQLAVNEDKYSVTNSIADESSKLLEHIMANMEEEWKRESETDYLTGLLNRKAGETKITSQMKDAHGCLAIVDLDNLKTINDTYGHIAGDYAIKTVAEVLSAHAHNAVSARIGGDEFIYYMNNTKEKEAVAVIESIIHSFRSRKTKYAEIKPASLSIGLSPATPIDTYTTVYQKADKALYYVKQNGKDGYAFYSASTRNNNASEQVDLKRIAESVLKQGMYQGTLGLEYREFTRLYNFINNMANRYSYNIQLLMITVEPAEGVEFYADAQNEVMAYMDKAIKDSLRNVDVATRFSGEQFLVILTNADKESINIITSRIREQFFNHYKRKTVKISCDVMDLSEQKNTK